MKSDVARYCHSLGRIVHARFRRNECQRTSRICFVRGMCFIVVARSTRNSHCWRSCTLIVARSLSHARGPLSTRARCNVDFFFFLLARAERRYEYSFAATCPLISFSCFLRCFSVFLCSVATTCYLLRDCFPLRRL